MADRELVPGNVVRADYGTAGQAKMIVTEGDDPGIAGQIPYSQGPGQPWIMGDLPASADSSADFQRFNISGTWVAPAGAAFGPNSRVLIRIWGAGGGGQAGGGGRAGGGGGGYNEVWKLLSELASTETVTVGSGGAAAGGQGGNSTFGTHVTGYGGGGGSTGTGGVGGGGGGPLSAGANTGVPGNPLISDGTNAHGSSANDVAGRSGIFHGGGGAGSANVAGGSSVYGGGGGGGQDGGSFSAGGTSVHGGAGGAGNGSNGVQPGGGGGADDAAAGAGGNGRVDVTVFPVA